MKRNTEAKLINEASLTIEASLVLPLFLFMMICFMSLSSLMLFQVRLKEGLHEEGKEIAMKKGGGIEYSVGDVREDVLLSIGEDILHLAPIDGKEAGITFSDTDISGDQIITLTAEYKAKLYYDFFGLFDRKFVQSSTFHTWCGYEDSINGIRGQEEDIEYVYVTEDSEVYHPNRDCTHLRLNVIAVSGSEIRDKRNVDGGKYHSCEHCHGKISDGTLYITTDGDCYHNSLSCSGLKRTVSAIPLNEAKKKGLRPCSRCGR